MSVDPPIFLLSIKSFGCPNEAKKLASIILGSDRESPVFSFRNSLIVVLIIFFISLLFAFCVNIYYILNAVDWIFFYIFVKRKM